ncbi:hypothetical protein [Metabacillus sediminilitoris]|uniref:Uncharacterized protein n=1 Tax=Metabacillus sediminilitoris TaxID=2567941 RepID=A0A4S4BUL2_9BACI|nr:hypothetical protein [Metabacillus sediminilitoris]QGQ45007.1 hypothetical protein GMB29_06850 [Metabacillus sediminilitoris]THF78640.1 hypothetical protein E6W99_15870 [Metabacillus sediminilitoris]
MKKKYKLEYRLNDEHLNYHALFHYEFSEPSEIFCRRLCDYFIKDKKVYHKTSTSLEDEYYVIYVEKDTEEYIFEDAKMYKHVTLEVRDYKEYSSSPLLFTYDLYSHEEALSLLGNDYLWINNEEYKKISAEIDEDRSTYVLYISES